MVAGITLFEASRRVKLLFASNDAGPIALLNTAWSAAFTGIFVCPDVGYVDTTAGVTRSVPVPVVNDFDGKLD